ncbi:MAG TPA: DUF1552 domain-containing protein [Pirellulaceae bacterium]|jgi:hypothetical protein
MRLNTSLLPRRHFLRSAGVSLALPFLPSLTRRGQATQPKVKRRFVAINLGLGFLSSNFTPAIAGKDYEPTQYLRHLDDFRSHFTVISGTSHPNVDGGHHAERSFLTAAPHPGSPSFKNTISVDQLAAETLGLETRFASLALTTGGLGLSWSRSGVEIPAISRPSVAFSRMFLEGDADEKAATRKWLAQGRSILDLTSDSARTVATKLSPRDRDKLDQYLTAVREAEIRLHKAEDWENRPKPKPPGPLPTDIENLADLVGRTRLLYDTIYLALASDSTRVITVCQPQFNGAPPIDGVTEGYHNLSHHGQDPGKLAQLTLIEIEQIKMFRDFMARLNAADDDGSSLLGHTSILLGSNLGNASSHSNENLPIILAGGGFKHGQHMAFSQLKNAPLPNLFVSILQRLGIESDRFASSTGTLTGLEMSST